MSRDGTATAPANAPSRPRYEPVMNCRWTAMRPSTAAHVPAVSVTNVSADSPWIQLKCPGSSSVMKNELSTVQYMATTHTRPTRRCARSPRGRRSSCQAPRTSASEAPEAWAAIRGVITLL